MSIIDQERYEDAAEMLRVAADAVRARIWTALPGIIVSFDPDRMTCSAQIATQMLQTNPDGSLTWVTVAPLQDIPVIFPRGGGFSLTFPVAEGDECLLLFASRCLDGWWQLGGVQKQLELRMHNLSDALCLPGPTSQPRVLPSISADSVQLRSDDGAAYVEVKEGHIVNIVGPGGINLTAGTAQIQMDPTGKITATAATEIDLQTPDTKLSGNLSGGTGGSGTAHFNGAVNATGEGTFNGHTVGGHTHAVANVQSGSSTITSNTPTG